MWPTVITGCSSMPSPAPKQHHHLGSHTLYTFQLDEFQGVATGCCMPQGTPPFGPHNLFLVLQLDEFQDVAHSQYRLLHALTCPSSSNSPAPLHGNRQRVTIVGDGDQAIYDWRGADVMLFEVCCFAPAFPPPPPFPPLLSLSPPTPEASPKFGVLGPS